MPRTQTIQVVIEVELTEYEQIIPHPPHPVVAQRPSPAEQLANEGHEQALLDMLRADSAQYAKFVRFLLAEVLGTYEANRQLVALAQISDAPEAGYSLLLDVVPRLPPAAATIRAERRECVQCCGGDAIAYPSGVSGSAN